MDRVDYRLFLGSAMIPVGIAMQWLRAFRWFKEWMYGAIATTILVGLFYIASPEWLSDWRRTFFECLAWLPGAGAALLSATALTSHVASKAANGGADSRSAGVPVTDSK